MKNYLRSALAALLIGLSLFSTGIVQAASFSDIVSFQGFLTATHGNQYPFTVRVKNTGADPGPLYLKVHIDETFQSDDPIIFVNTTGTTISCDYPPIYHCWTNGNAAVNGEFRVIWSGEWYNAGSFYADAWSSDSSGGTQHDYILKGPIVVN